MPATADQYIVDFPTLGFLVADWIEAHCPIHDGARKGEPFVMYDWQLWCTVNHYRVKVKATVGQLATAFFYRRSQIVAPQKTGKGPWAATIVLAEAVGPVVFDGWAKAGEVYRCADHGCPCGWEYVYEKGEPKGKPWPTPLIQLTATAEDQVENIYGPLKVMVKNGPLGVLVTAGEQFSRLPNDGLIDAVTSSARARLGNPIIFAMQDETGLYTKANKLSGMAQTQRRGAAGMGGRSMETTNAFDPSEQSTAQLTYESKRPDIFKFHRLPPPHLSYRNKEERARIHRYVYAGSEHVDLDGIEAEAAELIETDPAQAERFFGNRMPHGTGAWQPPHLWPRTLRRDILVPDGAAICLGFDGSESDDWTAIRAETLIERHRFTPLYGPDDSPTIWDPTEWGGQIPRSEVHAAIDEICNRYRVVRAYCDPRDYQSEIGDWALEYGDTVFFEWATYRIVHMHDALERAVTDLATDRSSHDDCEITARHVANARKLARPGQRYILGKPTQHQKIDAAMADTLAHEAAADALAAGWTPESESSYVYVM